MKPIIGITCGTLANPRTGLPHGKFQLNREYVDRVVAAGGAPVVIPPDSDPEAIAPLLDGLVIPGGEDLDPSLWGDSLHPEANLEYRGRTEVERRLVAALNPQAPILGICYGCQLMNVLCGGTLIQHLPDRLGDDRHRGDPIHTYQIDACSRLGGILGQSARGKSWHHQAIDRLGDGLQVVAWHEDGTIEAIESTTERWFIGVQWHPERTEVPETEKLFEAFMNAVRQSKMAESEL